MKLELHKFDMTTLKDDAVIVLLGARNTGKTVLAQSLLYTHSSIPAGIIISPTEAVNQSFTPYVPKMLIYDQYEPAIVERFVERQKKITAQYKEELRKYGRSDIDPRAFILLDDCMYDNSWVNDTAIRYLFFNGRHIKVLLIITMQFPLGIPPALRANVDYVFINRNNMIKDRERIYQQYAGMFPTFDIFQSVMNAATEDYHCVVINKRTQSNKLTDQVFWYKAPMGLKFRICSKELWDLQAIEEEKRALGLIQEVDDDELYDPQKFGKKSAIKLKVLRK